MLLRLPSALASAVLVIVTGLLARELGGERAAQVLAAASIAVASVVLGAGHLLSTTTFGLPAWAGLCWLVVRILRTGDDRLWLAAGLLAGAGLLDSDLVVFLMFAVRDRAGHRRAAAAAAVRLALRGRADRAGHVAALPGLAGPARLAGAGHLPVHRQRRVGHLGAPLGPAAGTARAGQPVPRGGVADRAGAPAARRHAALVPRARRGLPGAGRRVPGHRGQAVLPGGHVPAAARGRGSAGGGLGPARPSPAAAGPGRRRRWCSA